jgi:hypothetical protein
LRNRCSGWLDFGSIRGTTARIVRCRTIGITIQTIPGGAQTPVKLPANAQFGSPIWAPDGKQFAFAMYHPTQIELWIVDAQSGSARKVDGVVLNAVSGAAFQWMPDSRTLLCRTLPENRGAAPAAPMTPTGPNIQESYGKSAPVRTYQDLLKTAHDDALFEYYAASQLVLIDTASGRKENLANAELYSSVDPAPNGEYFWFPFSENRSRDSCRCMVLRMTFSFGIARETSFTSWPVFHRRKACPSKGVPTGPRSYHWRPTDDATLVWAEALDGGDPKPKCRTAIAFLSLESAVSRRTNEALKIEHRYSGVTWGERDGLAFVSDYDRDRRWQRTFLINFDRPASRPARLGPLGARSLSQPRHSNDARVAQRRTRDVANRKVYLPRWSGRITRGRLSVPRPLRPRDIPDGTTLSMRGWNLRICRRACERREFSALHHASRNAEHASKLLAPHRWRFAKHGADAGSPIRLRNFAKSQSNSSPTSGAMA